MRTSTPKPDEALACGSASMRRVFFSSVASEADRFMAEVVLPTPPFWFVNAMIFPIEVKMFSASNTNSMQN